MSTTNPELQRAAERHHADPSPRNRAAVVEAGLALVRSIVGRVRMPSHPLVTWEDLEGTAIEGFLQALDTYDPTVGAKFVTHAYRRTSGAVGDYLRSLDVLSRDKRRRVNDVYRAMETLRQQLGCEPTEAEVAAELGVPVEDVQESLGQAHLSFTLSLDEPVGESDGLLRRELLEDEGATAGFDAVERESLKAQIAREIPHLPERERRILGLYYFEGLTLKEVGAIIGVTDARISQILGQTMLTLRSRIMAERPVREAA